MVYENNESGGYIIDNHFIPCINWFKISINQSYINIFENERWKKMSFGNRCVIAGGNGLINLSVPVENGRNQKSLFREVKIAQNENWQVRHWRTIVSCYNRSPFFEYYEEGLHELFEKNFKYLFDLNIALIDKILYYLTDNKVIRRVDVEKFEHIDAKLNYLTPQNFDQDPSPIGYHQLFMDRHGFVPNLSIVDLLFMEGPNAKTLLNFYK